MTQDFITIKNKLPIGEPNARNQFYFISLKKDDFNLNPILFTIVNVFVSKLHDKDVFSERL